MTRAALALLGLLLAGAAHAQESAAETAATAAPSPPPAKRTVKHPHAATLWALLPGGGQFYLGDTAAGVTYAASTAAFLGAGLEVAHKNRRLGRTDEANEPELVAEKIWEFSVYDTFRDAQLAAGDDLRASGYDDTPTAQLLAAPFQLKQLTQPTVWGAALLGAAAAALGATGHVDGRLRDVSRVEMLGGDFNRDQGTALYGVSSFAISLGAATAEEGLFRGLLQPTLEQRWGPAGGLWATSGVFGALHIVAPDGHYQPAAVLEATASGAYLGWLYDNSDHRLANPVAAHFWYDFMIFAVSWAMDPNNTPLGVNVQFKF